MTARFFRNGLCLLFGMLLFGCSPNAREDGDSQTNWLDACRDDSSCDSGTKCLCGVCTRACSETNACSGAVQAGSCVGSTEAGAIAQCGGTLPPAPGLCLPRCNADGACAKGQACVAGVCSPLPMASVDVNLDLDTRHQELVGFGASVAYGEGQITGHPQQAELYHEIFAELGLDILRFRNRYGHTGDDDLSTAGDLVAAGSEILGRPLGIFLSSWSPPPALKANNALLCSGNVQTCTLAKVSGAFDYQGLADYWVASLAAYAKVGLVPDFVGIQNNPNWLPSSAETLEACKFLPVEGTVSVPVGLSTVRVTYPGLSEAQAATIAAFSALPNPPKLLAPETSDFGSVADYTPSLDPAKTEALAHQLYGVNPLAVDLDALAAMGKLVSQYGRPVFVTEMQADGFGSALMMHYATVVEGASAYLQAALTGPVSGPLTNTQALFGIDLSKFSIQDPYYAMRHFAAHTDPGWTRVEASTASTNGLLVSAWLSPSGQDLTLVLINTRSVELSARLKLPGAWSSSDVRRSVFSGIERFTALGVLSSEGVLRMPAESVVTVALSR